MADDRQRNRTPSLAEVIRAAIEQRLADVYTTIPGKIAKYDADTQKADVAPMLLRPLRDEDGNDLPSETLPVVPAVPVQFPRADIEGGKFFMSWPLKPGDAVTLHVAKWSLDQWEGKELGDPVDPVQFRQFDLSDCIAVPGAYPFKTVLVEADPDNLVIGRDEGGVQLHVLPDDTVEFRVGGAATEVAVRGNQLEQFYTNILKATYGDVHVHPTGMGPSGPPSPIMPAFGAAILSAFFKLNDS